MTASPPLFSLNFVRAFERNFEEDSNLSLDYYFFSIEKSFFFNRDRSLEEHFYRFLGKFDYRRINIYFYYNCLANFWTDWDRGTEICTSRQ